MEQAKQECLHRHSLLTLTRGVYFADNQNQKKKKKKKIASRTSRYLLFTLIYFNLTFNTWRLSYATLNTEHKISFQIEFHFLIIFTSVVVKKYIQILRQRIWFPILSGLSSHYVPSEENILINVIWSLIMLFNRRKLII